MTKALTTMDDPVTIDLFQGYDSLSSGGRTAAAVTGDRHSAGATSETYYRVCTDIETLQSSLNISASASASFGFGSGDAKTSYMRKLKVTTSSVTVVVYTNIITGSESAKNPKLTVPPPDDLNGFFQIYGDSYVKSVVKGGEYFATYVFYAESKEEQEQVTASLSAHGLVGGGTLSASFSSSLATARSSTKTFSSLQQSSSGFSTIHYPNEDGVIDFALNFANKKPDAPAVISYEVEGYERIPGMPSLEPIIRTRRLYEGVRNEPGLVDTYIALGSERNAAQRLQAIYDAYDFQADQQLTTRLGVISNEMKALDDFFQDMDDDPTRNWTAPAAPGSLAYGLPTLQARVQRTQYAGGNGGTAFDDFSASTVQAINRLHKLSVRYHNHVHQLFATYVTPDGTITPLNHGDDTNGDWTPELVLQPGEQISDLWVFSNLHIHQLRVTTTLGNVLTAPPQLTLPVGHPTTIFSIDFDHKFVGLAGRADNMIVGLDAVTVDFSPAVWSGDSPAVRRSTARKGTERSSSVSI
jgi:hypothetical protein